MIIRRYVDELSAEGINLIDIGSSGALDAKWNPIANLINLVGFDPNTEECERQNALPSRYRTARFLPYAIHGKSGTETLFKTQSIYCYSLLKPNSEWLGRFSFSHLFEIVGREPIEVRPLDAVQELAAFRPDAVKLDVQGLELPILKRAGAFLDHAFYVETETGFTENYVGETTYSQIDEFMRSQGFLMFDINVSHRIARDNEFKDLSTGKEQILWCESVWLKDYIALDKTNKFDAAGFSENKVKKILVLCALQGCLDYGLELAYFFEKHRLLPKAELDELKRPESWSLAAPPPAQEIQPVSPESAAGTTETSAAPVIFFVYNRLDHAQRTFESLRNNHLSSQSELYVYCDGPRNSEDIPRVEAVRAFIKTLGGFKKITVIERPQNLGLAKSVISGVSEILNRFGRAIIVEDDLELSPDFLRYMNEALRLYEGCQRIFSVGGYSPGIAIPESYKENSYLSYRCCTWGWGTWKDRFEKVDWDVRDYNAFVNDPKVVALFNRGGDDMSHILRLQMEGKLDSWGIRWDYAHFKNNSCCFRPVHSLVNSFGHDGSGVHCAKTDKYDVRISENGEFHFPDGASLEVDEEINRRFATFYDGKDRSGPGTGLPSRSSVFRRIAKVIRRWVG